MNNKLNSELLVKDKKIESLEIQYLSQCKILTQKEEQQIVLNKKLKEAERYFLFSPCLTTFLNCEFYFNLKLH